MAPTGFRSVEAEVLCADRISPAFVRIRLGGPGMAALGVDGPVLDQRFKLIVPDPHTGALELPGDGPGWYREWSALDQARRGAMRTYSIRRQLLTPDRTEWDVDMVLHGSHAAGPASAWAESARRGDRVGVHGPARGSGPTAGQAFRPGAARDLVLAGDETAAPAIARILEDLPTVAPGATGVALVEIPSAHDTPHIDVPAGMELRWLPRDGAPHGEPMTAALLESCGLPARDAAVTGDASGGASPDMTWDVPDVAGGDRYHWIAGESSVVVALRRALVAAGTPKDSVAFMGYWRRGAPMA